MLQTWAHDLFYDPHLHVVVPAGGLSPDGSRWIACRKTFPPKRERSRLFRRLFLRDLFATLEKGDLRFPGSISHLADPQTFAKLLARAGRSKWNVYAEPPFDGPQRFLRYLAANRTAFSNDRLLDIEGGKVRFTWKDYRLSGHRPKAMTLDGVEFVRRFLLHTVPDGFVGVRHFGLFANRHRAKNLRRCRELLATGCAACSRPRGSTSAPIARPQTAPEGAAPSCGGDQPADGGRLCPQCGRGRLRGTGISPLWLRRLSAQTRTEPS